MVYLNSAAPARRAPRSRPPARSTRPATPRRRRSAEARHPETGEPLFPQIIADRRGLRDRPGPRGLSRPDRPARRALLGPHQARARAGPGSRPTRTSPGPTAPRGSSPSPARGSRRAATSRPTCTDIAPTVLKLLGLPIPDHIEGTPARAASGDLPATVRQDGPAAGRSTARTAAAVRLHARGAGDHRTAAGRPRLPGMTIGRPGSGYRPSRKPCTHRVRRAGFNQPAHISALVRMKPAGSTSAIDAVPGRMPCPDRAASAGLAPMSRCRSVSPRMAHEMLRH